MNSQNDHKAFVGANSGSEQPGTSRSTSVTQVEQDLSPTDDTTHSANVVTWHPLNIQLHVWHPRMAWLELLIENKLSRGDSDAVASNAAAYLELIDKLNSHAIYGLIQQLDTKQEQISHALPVVIVASTILYFWLPMIGISFDVAGIVALFGWCWLIERRKAQLFNFIEELEISRAERCRLYCETRVDAYNGAVANV